MWRNGLAATVTFAPGTDMSAVTIDYASINTYVLSPVDPNCVPQLAAPCATLPAVYFNTDPPPAVVALSDTDEAYAYDVSLPRPARFCR